MTLTILPRLGLAILLHSYKTSESSVVHTCTSFFEVITSFFEVCKNVYNCSYRAERLGNYLTSENFMGVMRAILSS